MGSFFADGQAAFAGSGLRYIGTNTPATYEQYEEAAKGFVTKMAASSTDGMDNKNTVSQSEFQTRFKTSENLTKVLFNQKAELSIIEATLLLGTMDLFDKEGIDALLSQEYLKHLEAVATGSEQNIYALTEMMKPSIQSNLTTFNASSDKSKAEIRFSDAATDEGRWYDAREWMEAFLEGNQITATSIQNALGVDEANAKKLLETYGGKGATNMSSSQAANLLIDVAKNDNILSVQDRSNLQSSDNAPQSPAVPTVQSPVLDSTANLRTASPAEEANYLEKARAEAKQWAKSISKKNGGKKTVDQAEFLQGMQMNGLTHGEALVDLLFQGQPTVSVERAAQLKMELDKSDAGGLDSNVDATYLQQLNDAYNANDTSLADVTDRLKAAANTPNGSGENPADADKPLSRLLGIKVKNPLLLLGGLAAGVALLVGLFKKKPQPQFQPGQWPYDLSSIGFSDPSASAKSRGPLNVMQF